MDEESELHSLSDLERRLGEVVFPFDAVVPEVAKEWFTKFSAGNGTTHELLLISALASTSALIGKTVVKVFGSYEEPGNLFVIAVAPSPSGKTPACHLGCIDPIIENIEHKIEANIVMDETSVNGLFNHYVSGSTVPILCIDEANSFLQKLSFPSKSSQSTSLTMERLCKCFDGDCWFHLKGNKGKRTGVSSARLSILAFTTPRQFLEKAWPRIINAENGLADRIMLVFQKRIDRDLEEMAEMAQEIEATTMTSLKGVLEHIFVEHNDQTVKYELNASAREAFFKFAKAPGGNAAATHSLSSKRNKHVLRVALNMHVLYERLRKALQHVTGPTDKTITLPTMNMAITLVETLETYKGISETCCQLLKSPAEVVKLGVSSQEIKKNIINIPGAVATARGVYTSFSSKNRPSTKNVQLCMQELENEGLGVFKAVEKLKVFYKTLPKDDLKAKLAFYEMSLESYTNISNKENPKMTNP